MDFHNIYGYGQLFAFSGLDGETSYKKDFVGMLLDDPVTIRFHFENAVTIKFPLDASVKFNAVAGEFLDADGFFVVFKDKYTLVGKAIVKPSIFTEKPCYRSINGNLETLRTAEGCFYFSVEEKNGFYYFIFSFNEKQNFVLFDEQLDLLKKEKYAYYESKPKCRESRYERLYYKCLTVNKKNVYSKEGNINCRWTTPDRVPHKHMWLWDSAFHAMAFSEYDLEMAKDCIRSVLSVQEENGFIAHMLTPFGAISNLTQPQVLSWATWTVYQKDKDKQFLKECAQGLKKYLLWTKENRDVNGNGLLEWFTEPEYTDCRCGESGLDNSPRFDFDIEMDAIDFSSYLCNDAKYLSKIFAELGEIDDEKIFSDLHNQLKDNINDYLWYEDGGFYCDRVFGGDFTKVVTPSSFLPMMLGICSSQRAEKMVKIIVDENKFWTEMPLPSIAKDHPAYNGDMWRGGAWVNINYFIILGLRKYGYYDLAEKVREKTLNVINHRYLETGNLFEFYDAENKISPFKLNRKGAQPEKPDYRVHIHAITDFNWTACFTAMLIQQNWN